MRFEWDTRKAKANLQSHGVTFEEASSVFGDPLAGTVFDHSEDEPRLVTIRESTSKRLIVVVHTDRDDAIRIIKCSTGSWARKEEI